MTTKPIFSSYNLRSKRKTLATPPQSKKSLSKKGKRKFTRILKQDFLTHKENFKSALFNISQNGDRESGASDLKHINSSVKLLSAQNGDIDALSLTVGVWIAISKTIISQIIIILIA